jgi:acetylornithine deacetylase
MNLKKQDPKDWVQKNKDELIKLIREMVKIPSVSGKEGDVQKFIFQKLSELNLNPKYIYPDVSLLEKSDDYFKTTSFVKYGYDNRPNVTGILKGSGNGKSMCLSGHVDVVSPEPVEHWSHDPWGNSATRGCNY